jgi:hypothetical protein
MNAWGLRCGSWPWLVLLSLSACAQRWWVCDDVDDAELRKLPHRLSATGLYRDVLDERLAEGVLPYRPRFELWSDGARKRRWLRLPPGTRIDTRDMDDWIFPVGTKLWKEFTRDGIRVETRLLHKIGPAEDDWIGVAYLWADDQHDAFATPYGAIDAQSTRHNVPAASECRACHASTRSFVLGVSAIQLGRAAEASDLTLSTLSEQGLLSDPPADAVLALPGNATEQAALGYLHANCANCHNQARPAASGARCFDPESELDFRLSVHALGTLEATATYRTMGANVRAGRPDKSRLIELVSGRGFFRQMPPLGSDQVDHEGLLLLRRWVEQMGAHP